MSTVKRRKLDQSAHNGFHCANEPVPKGQEASKRLITADMYGKDLVQIQTDDLLSELSSSRQRRLSRAKALLNQLKACIETIPEKLPAAPVAAEQKLWRESKIAVPYPEPRPESDVNYTVAYERPSQINVVGSFATDTALVRRRHVPTIDMCVTMPAAVLQPKDYLNHRYFHKRAYYLSCIAAGLSKIKGDLFSLNYDFLNGSNLQPVIIVVPDVEEPKFRIQLMVTAPSNFFSVKKTLPHQNCVRSVINQGSADPKDQAPTPLYNASVRAECNAEAYLKLLHATSKTSENFSQACVLLRVWLCQRGLGSALPDGGFGGFEASVLVALLLEGGASRGHPLLSSGYSSFQLFKAALQFIHKRDLVSDPLLVKADGELSKKALSEYYPMLWDGPRNMNILYKMNPSSYSLLRHQARHTIEALQDVSPDAFDSTFMVSMDDVYRVYDDTVSISGNTATFERLKTYEGLSKGLLFAQDVHSALSKALGERHQLITSRSNDSSEWANLCDPPNQPVPTVEVSLLLDPKHYNRIVDRGPPAEHKVAALEYQEFWGPKTELRRFQDGGILESVIWQRGKGIEAVHRQVIAHICQRKFGSKVNFIGLDPTYQETLPTFASDSLDRMNSALRSFEEFEDRLKNLEKLPLHVKSCIPHLFELANVPNAAPKEDRIDAVLQLEGSANWPEHLVAIQRTKLALLLRIAELMEGNHSHYSCRVGLEESSSQLNNIAVMDVRVSDQSPVIRIRIQCEREIELLSRKLRLARSVAERQAVTETMTLFDRFFLRSPAHFQAVRQLGLRMPVLIPSIMLFRKWCSSHLLTAHMSVQLIELLVIRAFTHPYPYSPPANAATALLRILDFLTRWNWHLEPLLVDINDSMTTQQISEASLRFQAWRKVDPKNDRLAIFAASNVDTDGATWTNNGPSKAVMSRIVALAKAASSQTKRVEDQCFNLSGIFSTGLADFDFVIHLDPKLLHNHTLDRKVAAYKNLQTDQNRYEGCSLAATVPSSMEMFIAEISHSFADVLIFFHDWAERPLIAALWMPNVGSKNWKVGLDYSSSPTKQANVENRNDLAKVNRAGVLNDLARLGGDLVLRIDVD